MASPNLNLTLKLVPRNHLPRLLSPMISPLTTHIRASKKSRFWTRPPEYSNVGHHYASLCPFQAVGTHWTLRWCLCVLDNSNLTDSAKDAWTLRWILVMRNVQFVKRLTHPTFKISFKRDTKSQSHYLHHITLVMWQFQGIWKWMNSAVSLLALQVHLSVSKTNLDNMTYLCMQS